MVFRWIALVSIACALLPMAARGASEDAVAVELTLVSSGPLSVSNPATASVETTLNGLDQTVNYTVPLNVTDSRNSGAGWNLSITSTTFDDGAGHALAADASRITAIASVCTSDSCTSPRNKIKYPLALPAATTPPTAIKFFNATRRSGMGQFAVTPTIQVEIPGNSYAGTYASTLTIAISSGP